MSIDATRILRTRQIMHSLTLYTVVSRTRTPRRGLHQALQAGLSGRAGQARRGESAPEGGGRGWVRRG
jgi:hypothetical protein